MHRGMFFLFSPFLFKGFKFYSHPLTGGCHPLFRATGTAAPSSPSCSLLRRSLWHTGSVSPRAAPAARPRPSRRPEPSPSPALHLPPGRGGADLPTTCARPVKRPRVSVGPASPLSYLVPELTGDSALHGARGAGAARVREVRGARALRGRLRRRGRAPRRWEAQPPLLAAAAAAYSIRGPRPTPPPLPYLAALSGTSCRAAITSMRPQAWVV